MSYEQGFWWNWWVQFAVAVGTFLAVLAALFGDQIRRYVFPPRLFLSVLNFQGSTTPVDLLAPDGSVRRTTARYYHVSVMNHRRHISPATQTRVSLLRMEEPAADGRFVPTWIGDVPLRWRFQEAQSTITPTIGPDAAVDLCSVIKGKWLEIYPLFTPNNLQTRFTKAADFILVLQARSTQVDSMPIRVRICWDGEWADDGEEMSRHLTVRLVNPFDSAS